MPTLADTDPVPESEARGLFREAREAIYRHTDRMFAYLMLFQWLAGITAALFVSPKTWIGTTSQTHWHVWAAIFLGGTITSLPVVLAWKQPGSALTRYIIAVAQMMFSALLIHLAGGRIETHFHVFGSLAFLAIYRDGKVLVTATVVTVVDHFVRGALWPQSVFGILTPSPWRGLEHAGWVFFEVTFLLIATRRSLRDMFDVATRRARLENLNARIEQQVGARTAALVSAHEELQGSEQRFASAFEHAAIGMALVSLEGRWLKVNRALCLLTGYSAEEMYERTFQDITHPADLNEDLWQVQQILAGEVDSCQMEKRYLHKDGRAVWVLMSATLIRAQGQPLHFFSQIQDITERKDAEARLGTMHLELLEVSRRAGMAEVATSVLHNVGNVLNSVNVSCSLVAERVRNSHVGSVSKTAGLLREHAADPVAFFTADPRARQLPDYLGKLGGRLEEERAELLRELQLLAKNIDHIKGIVAMQQNHAKASGITETVSVEDLVEDSLRMNSDSLVRHRVEVVRDYAEVPPVTLERPKAVQILVNLIRNAKQACDGSAAANKRITVRLTRGRGCVRIAVMDNGGGIAPENLTRIFAHGFTTKPQGHGFGLHSGALAAEEMGGSLTVHSDGEGAGATFTLELPIHASAEPPTQP